MSLILPSPDESFLALRAKGAARIEELAAVESAKRTTLRAELGAAYRLGEAATASDPEGLDLSAGLRAAIGRSGIEAAASAGWNPEAGPSASFSLSWKPPPPGDETLRDRDEELASRQRELEVEAAVREARELIAALEDKRRELADDARDAREDLDAAAEQAAAYAAQRERGLVGDAEYAEVTAALDECRARSGAAVLDRMAWSIDARLLSAAEIGGDE